jgi:hypothetical protein
MKAFIEHTATTLLLILTFNPEHIMSKSNSSGTPAGHQQRALPMSTRRVVSSCDARAIAMCFAIIGVIATDGRTIVLMSQYPLPTVANDLQQSDMLSQVGNRTTAVTANRKAVDFYRSPMRLGMMQYDPKLAASLQRPFDSARGG